MTIYAHIVNGAVAELFTPPAGVPITACFNPSLVWVDVTAVSPAPQPNWTAVETAGVWSFAAPVVTAPTAQQIAAAAYAALIAGGLTITSTGTPAISGVYPIDAQSQSDLAVEAQFISTFAEFTNGATTGLSWLLLNGSMVTFPTTAAFLNVAKAAAQTVAAGKLAVLQGTAMPSASVTIA